MTDFAMSNLAASLIIRETVCSWWTL